MAAIDKAAIGWSIGIVAVGIAFALYGQGVQDQGGFAPAPVTSPETSMTAPVEEPTQVDPFAERAAQVIEQQAEREAAMEEQMEMVEEPMMEEEPMVEEESMMMEDESSVTVSEPTVEETPVAAGPQTVSVSMPAGTSVPGCEETNECYIPASVTINAGDTVSWINDDTAAHTVTSGTPADGPDGLFDSSLVLGGATFEHTFDDAGSYDYFCMVHPWMIGDVQVN